MVLTLPFVYCRVLRVLGLVASLFLLALGDDQMKTKTTDSGAGKVTYGFITDSAGQEVPNGLYEERTPEGVTVIKGHYDHGRLEGTFRAWDKNGKLNQKTTYHKGRIIDTTFTWFPSGALYEKGFYPCGELKWVRGWNENGTYRFKGWYVNDSIFRTQRWDESGNKIQDTTQVIPRDSNERMAEDCFVGKARRHKK
jgi:antitoxin component YwqK of YwqJK toxin-antitoxin module